MIIFLYGSDSYRRNKKLRELLTAYKGRHATVDIAEFDLENEPEKWLMAKEFLGQPSLFLDLKVLVVRESGAVGEKEWGEALKKEIETPKTFVLISDYSPPPRNLGFLLKKSVQFQKFEELNGPALEKFIQEEAARRNIVFAADARYYFRAYVGRSSERSWLVVNFLDEVALAGFKTPVAAQNLQSVLPPLAADFSFLEVKRLLNEPKITKKLLVLENLLSTKEDPARIFNSLAYAVSGKGLLRLADYDVAVKSGSLTYEEALLDFVTG